MSNKVLLMILDGWGIGNGTKSDVISQIHPAYISAMTEKYPHAELRTYGENVGLPNGQMGNSEVGHLNIGAGRVVYQDLVKINRACADDSIYENEEIVKAFEYAKANGVNVHFLQSTTSISWPRLLQSMASRTPLFTALWMVAIPTPRAVRALLPMSRLHSPSVQARLLQSLAATTLWTAISAGSV